MRSLARHGDPSAGLDPAAAINRGHLSIGQWFLTTDSPRGGALTIVTVVRREHAALQCTLESLVAHGFGKCELVVIEGDDVDSDRAAELRSRFSNDFDQLQWLLSPDDGIYDAMNRGLFAATGEWIWCLNAGDIVDGALSYETMVDYLRPLQQDWIVASARLVDGGTESLLKTSSDFSVSALRTGAYVPCHQAVLTRRRALAAVSGFSSQYEISGDYDLFLRLSERAAPNLWNRVIVEYQTGGASAVRWRRRNIEAALARRRVVGRGSWRSEVIGCAKLMRRIITPRAVHALRLKRTARRSRSDPNDK